MTLLDDQLHAMGVELRSPVRPQHDHYGCACQRAGLAPFAASLHAVVPYQGGALPDLSTVSAWCQRCGEVWAVGS